MTTAGRVSGPDGVSCRVETGPSVIASTRGSSVTSWEWSRTSGHDATSPTQEPRQGRPGPSAVSRTRLPPGNDVTHPDDRAEQRWTPGGLLLTDIAMGIDCGDLLRTRRVLGSGRADPSNPKAAVTSVPASTVRRQVRTLVPQPISQRLKREPGFAAAVRVSVVPSLKCAAHRLAPAPQTIPGGSLRIVPPPPTVAATRVRFRTKRPRTTRSASAETTHTGFVPLHPPTQPTNSKCSAGAARTTTMAPGVTRRVQLAHATESLRRRPRPSARSEIVDAPKPEPAPRDALAVSVVAPETKQTARETASNANPDRNDDLALT